MAQGQPQLPALNKLGPGPSGVPAALLMSRCTTSFWSTKSILKYSLQAASTALWALKSTPSTTKVQSHKSPSCRCWFSCSKTCWLCWGKSMAGESQTASALAQRKDAGHNTYPKLPGEKCRETGGIKKSPRKQTTPGTLCQPRPAQRLRASWVNQPGKFPTPKSTGRPTRNGHLCVLPGNNIKKSKNKQNIDCCQHFKKKEKTRSA